jgi:predicted heme/steroid binding protein
MVVMGITGAILFVYRVPSFASLLESRFGILLLLKIGLYLIMVCTALFAVFFLAPRMRKKPQLASAAKTGDLTLAELAQCDGKDGRPTYFAYKGEIFDASNSPKWKNGVHMGRHPAGGDLTEQLGQAPHGEDLVLALPKVGTLRSAAAPGLTPPQKVFYTIAYLNLGFVLGIILILACWKWL